MICLIRSFVHLNICGRQRRPNFPQFLLTKNYGPTFIGDNVTDGFPLLFEFDYYVH